MSVGDLYSVTPAGSVPFQPGPVIAYFCALVPVVRLPGHLEHVGPAVEHREQEVAALHVGKAEIQGSLRDVEPGGGVERVGVGRGDVA